MKFNLSSKTITILFKFFVSWFWAYGAFLILLVGNFALLGFIQVQESVVVQNLGQAAEKLFQSENVSQIFSEAISFPLSNLIDPAALLLLLIWSVGFLLIAFLASPSANKIVLYGVAMVSVAFAVILFLTLLVACRGTDCPAGVYAYFASHLWWVFAAGSIPPLYLSSKSQAAFGGALFWKTGVVTLVGVFLLWLFGTTPFWLNFLFA